MEEEEDSNRCAGARGMLREPVLMKVVQDPLADDVQVCVQQL